MSDLDSSLRPRRVVYDVQRPEQTKSRKRRRGHGKKPGQQPAKFMQPVLSDDDDQQRLPLEMTPLIQAAIDYGRKTHALGALKTANTLASIVAKLKETGLIHPIVLDVIIEAETESKKIFGMFNIAYNAPEDDHVSMT